jgi:Virulence-associated protein E/Domain of unknown function (DUF3854)
MKLANVHASDRLSHFASFPDSTGKIIDLAHHNGATRISIDGVTCGYLYDTSWPNIQSCVTISNLLAYPGDYEDHDCEPLGFTDCEPYYAIADYAAHAAALETAFNLTPAPLEQQPRSHAHRIDPDQLKDLKDSGICDAVIAHNFESLRKNYAIRGALGHVGDHPAKIQATKAWKHTGVDPKTGLDYPSSQPPNITIKPFNNPRYKLKNGTNALEDDDSGKPIKYEYPKENSYGMSFLRVPDFESGQGVNTDYWPKAIANIKQPLLITEGVKKAGCVLTILKGAIAPIPLNGVWGWAATRTDDEKKQKKPKELRDELRQFFHTKGRKVYICFDSDQWNKEGVMLAQIELGAALEKLGAIVRYINLAGTEAESRRVKEGYSGDGKVGIDDHLVCFPEGDRGAEMVRLQDEAIALEELREKAKAAGFATLGDKAEFLQVPQKCGIVNFEMHNPLKHFLRHRIPDLRFNTRSQEYLQSSSPLSYESIRAKLDGVPLTPEEKSLFTYDANKDRKGNNNPWLGDVFAYIKNPSVLKSVLTELQESELAFDPVKDYLDSLLIFNSQAANDYLKQFVLDTFDYGADTLESTLITRWFISAIARAYDPGCKADSVLTFVGAQGHKKTSFFEVMAGKDHFLTLSATSTDKDSVLLLQTGWLVEKGEVDSFTRLKDMSGLKAFISEKVDSCRPPYGVDIKKYPRRTVFCATTNEERFLNDPTGNRRWWPVKIQKRIDLDAVSKARDEVWAAAIALYKSGEQWWLTDLEEKRLSNIHSAFEVENPYLELLDLALNNWLNGDHIGLTMTNIVTMVLGKSEGVIKSIKDKDLIKKALKELGYSVGRKRPPGGGSQGDYWTKADWGDDWKADDGTLNQAQQSITHNRPPTY